jgi:hypothetical protein
MVSTHVDIENTELDAGETKVRLICSRLTALTIDPPRT